MSRTIDMTPTFEQAGRMCITLLEDGNFEGKKTARAELLRYLRQYDEMLAKATPEAMRKVHAVSRGGDITALFADEFDAREFADSHTGNCEVVDWLIPAETFELEE